MSNLRQFEMADEERSDFLRRLDASDVTVTEWEAEFLASFLAYVNPVNFWLGFERRREACDKMRKRYEHQLPSPKLPRRPQPVAQPNRCAYRIRDERGEPRFCGEPAICRTQQGLELCKAHDELRAEQVQRLRELKARPLRH